MCATLPGKGSLANTDARGSVSGSHRQQASARATMIAVITPKTARQPQVWASQPPKTGVAK
mgnify:CR=1 FL=1